MMTKSASKTIAVSKQKGKPTKVKSPRGKPMQCKPKGTMGRGY